jgi:hypothetical protein
MSTYVALPGIRLASRSTVTVVAIDGPLMSAGSGATNGAGRSIVHNRHHLYLIGDVASNNLGPHGDTTLIHDLLRLGELNASGSCGWR